MATKEIPKSKVWAFFARAEDGGVTCNLCHSVISQGSKEVSKKNTSNLWWHLRTHHKKEHEEIQKEILLEKRETGGGVQTTIEENFNQMRKWKNTDSRSKTMDRLIVEMVATDNRPFAIVTSPGFKRLMAAAEPRYTIKDEKYYRTEMFPLLYNLVEAKIRDLISVEMAGPYLAFTTDCWSGKTESLMSLTIHFIDNGWERRHAVLNAKVMTGSHTGEYIGSIFTDMLQYWKIEESRVFIVLRDGGANMIKGMNLIDVPSLSCFAHSLQLIIQDGFKAQRAVQDLLSKLRNVASHFNHSVLAKQRLEAIQKRISAPDHSILQAIQTRWNSSLDMMVRMIEQKHALAVYESEYGTISCPTATEWGLADNLTQTLQPFKDMTLEVSRDDACLSLIITHVCAIRILLKDCGPKTKGIQTMRSTMLKVLEKKYSEVEQNKQLVLSCFLDPRFKNKIVTPATSEKAKSWLLEEIKDNSPSPTLEKRPRLDSDQCTPSTSSLDAVFQSMLGGSPSQEVSPDEEIARYISEPVAHRKMTSPHKWWKENGGRFPSLKSVARKYLCAPPTSVPSERLFSEVGNIYSDKRYSLTGSNAEKLSFLHDNLRILDWKYM